MRTQRLCQRVLMFHHFPDNLQRQDTLVRSVSFAYKESPTTSFLTAFIENGHYYEPSTGKLFTQSMPPFEFEYSKAPKWNDLPIQKLDSSALLGLPGDHGETISWLDFNGDGSASLLAEYAGDARSYQRNEKCSSDDGPHFFGRKIQLNSLPAHSPISKHYFEDLDGDGKLDLVCTDNHGQDLGYYRRRDSGWEEFTRFDSVPNLDTRSPSMKRIDLTGNGLLDLLQLDPVTGNLLWYECLGQLGFGPEQRVPRCATTPRLMTGDENCVVQLADMTGDGLVGIVTVSQGRISYWPNLSRGHFGQEVLMSNSPQLDTSPDFDITKVQLVDIDGSGTADILYFPSEGGVNIHLNLAGNGWGRVQRILSFPRLDQAGSIFTMDLLGNGTSCLCWTGPDATNTAQSDLHYIDLTAGQKPNILKSYANGYGAQVSVQYKSSNWYFLQDERKGTPWNTKIGFPVHCVSDVTTSDAISGVTVSSRYAYHHGYFDRIEKEFRGFGMVEHWDSETFSDDKSGGFWRPPIHTKTWYHTGAIDPSPYVLGASQRISLLSSKLPMGLTTAEIPDVYRAFNGMLIREEIYSADKSKFAKIPYQTTEHTYEIHRVQEPRKDSMAYDVPKRMHELVLETDDYNNVRKSATISYGRGTSDLKGLMDQERQLETTFHLLEDDFTDPVTEQYAFRAPAPNASRRYRVLGSTEVQLFDYDSVKNTDFEALFDDCQVQTTGASPQPSRRMVLLSEHRTMYRNNNLSKTLNPGELDAYSVVDRSLELTFQSSTIQAAYGETIGPISMPIESAMSLGGYINLAKMWWEPSPRSFYGTEGPDEMDEFWLMPIEIADAFGGITKAKNDYAHLETTEITDINLNRQQSLFDCFGRLVASCALGKSSETIGDEMNQIKPNLTNQETTDFFQKPTCEAAAALLKGAGMRRIYYDTNYPISRQTPLVRPAVLADITRTSHIHGGLEAGNIMISISYLDGNASTLQTLELATEDKGTQSWHISGWITKNSRGDPMRTFRPCFTTSHEFTFQSQVQSPATTFLYDSLGRTIGTLHPDHTYHKIRIGSWQQTTFDEGDTALNKDPSTDEDLGPFFAGLDRDCYLPTWYQQRVAIEQSTYDRDVAKISELAKKVEAYSDTPNVTHFDCEGQPILEVSDNKTSKIYTRIGYDLSGNRNQLTDGLNRVCETVKYDLGGRVLSVEGMDNGTHWSFVDCMDRALMKWNSGKWSTRIEYDALRRETDVLLFNKGKDGLLVKRTEYGNQNSDISTNSRGHIVRVLDQAGMRTNVEFNFKGNCLKIATQFATEFKTLIDLSKKVSLEEEIFVSKTQFDALNRGHIQYEPSPPDIEGAATKHVFSKLGFLEEVLWRPSMDAKWEEYAIKMVYTAEGQLASTRFGNGTTQRVEYDASSCLMIRKIISRGSGVILEDSQFTYDPTRRVSRIIDKAQKADFFENTLVEPSFEYSYDAIGQLIAAEGRQQINVGPQGLRAFQSHGATGTLAQKGIPGNGRQICKYLETYEYDSAGNMLRMKHEASEVSAKISGWTRDYTYSKDPDVPSNRLLVTQDGKTTETYSYDEDSVSSGCISSVSGYRSFTWDFADKLRSSLTQILNDGTPETTWYFYDSDGTRIRKITERSAAGEATSTKLKEIIYLGSLNIRHKFSGKNTLQKETRTSEVMGTHRVAIMEITTDRPDHPLIRYQASENLELDDQGQIVSYNEYSPFGTVTFSMLRSDVKAPRRYRYSGYLRDNETGLDYCNARYYASWLGRWMSPDPLGTIDGLDLFAYVSNDLINFDDPSGTMEVRKVKKVFLNQMRLKSDAAKDSVNQNSGTQAVNSGAAPKKSQSNAKHSVINVVRRLTSKTSNSIKPIKKANDGPPIEPKAEPVTVKVETTTTLPEKPKMVTSGTQTDPVQFVDSPAQTDKIKEVLKTVVAKRNSILNKSLPIISEKPPSEKRITRSKLNISSAINASNFNTKKHKIQIQEMTTKGSAPPPGKQSKEKTLKKNFKDVRHLIKGLRNSEV